LSKPAYILVDGELVPFDDAKVHVLSPAVTYALTVFEGIRAYWNEDTRELYLFRLEDHLLRLQRSMRMMRFAATYSVESMRQQILRLVRANNLKENIHLRVMACQRRPNPYGDRSVSFVVRQALTRHVVGR